LANYFDVWTTVRRVETNWNTYLSFFAEKLLSFRSSEEISFKSGSLQNSNVPAVPAESSIVNLLWPVLYTIYVFNWRPVGHSASKSRTVRVYRSTTAVEHVAQSYATYYIIIIIVKVFAANTHMEIVHIRLLALIYYRMYYGDRSSGCRRLTWRYGGIYFHHHHRINVYMSHILFGTTTRSMANKCYTPRLLFYVSWHRILSILIVDTNNYLLW